MKTKEELELLAESSMKFLGGFFDEEINRWVLPKGVWNFLGRTLHPKDLSHVLFESQYAPIFAHLALQEILKRRYRVVSVSAESIGDDNSVTISGLDDQTDQMYTASDNNYFIALWSAIEEAEKK